MLLHKIAFSTFYIQNFSGTRFPEKKYFFTHKNICELGAAEGLGARGSLQTGIQVTK